MHGQRRIRTITPDVTDNPDLAGCSRNARLTWLLLHTLADDVGRFLADARLVRSGCYPFDGFDASEIARDLEELSAAGMIQLYEVGRKRYGVITPWGQRIDRPTESAFPAPPLTLVVEQDLPLGERTAQQAPMTLQEIGEQLARKMSAR